MQLVIETSGGKVRGGAQEGVRRFLGIPYGSDTAGANRFHAPKPVAWAGVRDALDCGPPSPQEIRGDPGLGITWLRDPRPVSEDCLTLNVFTPRAGDAGEGLPVMVYLHGGAFRVGSAGAPGVDGSNLAARGAVVVSVNHRLNVFGHLWLGDRDDRYADAGNAGMLDLVAALEWIQRNIGRFGGDAGNVTLFGQSGGGSKVAVLMAMPRARGLFHKAIIQSASSLLALATPEEAERNTWFFLRQLGIAREGLGRLHEVPATTLVKAMQDATKAAGGVDNYRPVVDGRLLPCQPFDAEAVRLSSHVPLMTGWCENEQRMNFAATPAVYAQGAQQALASTARALGVSPVEAALLMDVYRRGRPADSSGDLYAQILGDHRYRRSVTRAAESQVVHAGAPVYTYLLKWKTPLLRGLLRSPHTLCLAFAFGNVDVPGGLTGTGADRYRLQEEMAGAWIAFGRSGDPNHAGLARWKPYTLEERATMVFDRPTRLEHDPLRAERIALEDCPPYVPAIAEGGGHHADRSSDQALSLTDATSSTN